MIGANDGSGNVRLNERLGASELLEILELLEQKRDQCERYRSALVEITDLSGRKPDLGDAQRIAYAALECG